MKYLDENGLLYYTQKVKTWLGGKVDKETGKGLSTNDYTTTEKNKLAGIAAGAEVNVQADWNATSGDAMILNKPTIPPSATVDTAMSSSSTNAVQNKVIKSYVDSAIGGITGIDFQVVSALPATGVKGVIYLKSNSGSGQNVYDEYIWVTNGGTSNFEKIGTTDVDLSSYYTKTEADTLLAAKADDADVVHNTGNETIQGDKTFVADRNGILFKIGNASILQLGSNSVERSKFYGALYDVNDNPFLTGSNMTAITNAEIDTICS